MYPACSSVLIGQQTGLSEVPVILCCFNICSARTGANGSAFLLGVEWGCGPSAPLIPSGSTGISSYFSPSSRGLFSRSLLTIFNALDGHCLTVSNMGVPTQEGSLLRLYISSISAGEVKRT